MKGKEDLTKLVEVYNGSPWEADLLKGLLKSNDINSTLKDGLITSIAPYISPTVSLLVNDVDYESAMEIINSRDKKQQKK